MIILPPKQPTEAVRYNTNWARKLGDDTITSALITVQSGSAAINSQGFDDENTWAVISGGAAGVACLFALTIGTAAGQLLYEFWSLTCQTGAESIFPSTTTKGQIEDMAFEEIGLAGYEFDATAEEQASGLRRLDSLMSMWRGPGVNLDLNYNFPAAIGQSNRADVSGIPDMALEAVVISLALSIMPAIGKTMSPETRVRLNQAMTATRAAMAQIPAVSLPNSTAFGAGAKPFSTWQPFQGSLGQ